MYLVTVAGDGTVTYIGENDVKIEGVKDGFGYITANKVTVPAATLKQP